jgi:hypothetical protein
MLYFFYLLLGAFKIWMLVDSIRRRAEFFWFWIIILVPGGAWVYFFMVKIQDYDLKGLKRAIGAERAPSLKDLQYLAQQTPSVGNLSRLGEALYDAEKFGEAVELFERVLETHPDDLAARHGLGLCQIELERHEDAVENLGRVVEKDIAYRDYRVCLDLAVACRRAGRQEDAARVLEQLVRRSPTTEHHLALAQQLVWTERREEAAAVLDRALEQYEHAPSYVKRRDRRTARAASEMRRQLDA